MKKTIFEEMGGTYIRHGDYLIPALTLPKEEEQRVVGVWGQRHLRYLKEYRRNVYLDLLMSGRLNSFLSDIEELAKESFDRLIDQMMQAQGITELMYKSIFAGVFPGTFLTASMCVSRGINFYFLLITSAILTVIVYILELKFSRKKHAATSEYN